MEEKMQNKKMLLSTILIFQAEPGLTYIQKNGKDFSMHMW